MLSTRSHFRGTRFRSKPTCGRWQNQCFSRISLDWTSSEGNDVQLRSVVPIDINAHSILLIVILTVIMEQRTAVDVNPRFKSGTVGTMTSRARREMQSASLYRTECRLLSSHWERKRALQLLVNINFRTKHVSPLLLNVARVPSVVVGTS